MPVCAMDIAIGSFFIRLYNRLKRCWKRSHSHRHQVTAAALAFYSLISLVPILISGITIAAWLVDEDTAKESLLDETSSVAGSNVAKYFAELLNKDIQSTGGGISPIIGGLFLIFSATKMLTELRKCLSRIFGTSEKLKQIRAKSKVKAKVLQILMNRGVSIALLLFIGIFIASLVVMQALLGFIINATSVVLPSPWIASMSAPIFSFISVTMMCSIAIRWLPQNPPTFKIALQGGVVSALLLAILKFGLLLMLQYGDVGSYFGSAVTLVLVLFWIYFAMQAFLFGAEYSAGLVREQKANARKNNIDNADSSLG